MLDRARVREGKIARIWAVSAGLTAGLGVWATHFVAMTAYDVGLPLSFSLVPLFGSLAISFAAQICALWLVHRARSITGGVCGGALAGLGIIGMHYVGMLGLEARAVMHWD